MSVGCWSCQRGRFLFFGLGIFFSCLSDRGTGGIRHTLSSIEDEALRTGARGRTNGFSGCRILHTFQSLVMLVGGCCSLLCSLFLVTLSKRTLATRWLFKDAGLRDLRLVATDARTYILLDANHRISHDRNISSKLLARSRRSRSPTAPGVSAVVSPTSLSTTPMEPAKLSPLSMVFLLTIARSRYVLTLKWHATVSTV